MGGIGIGIGVSNLGFATKTSAVSSPEFIISVKTDNAGTSTSTQFTLPMVAGTYDVDWGDGNIDLSQVGTQTHTYSVAGTYEIKVTGGTEIKFNLGGDRLKLLLIKNWGTSTWLRFNSSFNGCSNLDITATDIPDMSTPNFSMQSAFKDCTSLVWNSTVNNWNTTNVTSMASTFRGSTFNQDISNWDLSSCTSISDMFLLNTGFNSPVDFGTSNVTNMFRVFGFCTNFNQDISGWTVSQVTNLSNFMESATSLSTANYDSLLIAWDNQGAMLYSGTVNFGGSKYTSGGAAETARTSLISKWGAIVDGGAA